MAVLDGDAGDNKIIGGNGDDSITGFQGDDTLSGRDGNDTILGKNGEDKIIGGEGDDWLRGGGDDDFIRGDNGDDIVHGDEGDDELYGGRGDDTIKGGDDNDTIQGGKGSDEMEGGSGEDVFAFRLTNDFAGKNANADVVLDFVIDEDLIDFVNWEPDTYRVEVSDIASSGDDLVFTMALSANNNVEKGSITLVGLGDDFDLAADKGAFIDSLFVVEDQHWGDFFL